MIKSLYIRNFQSHKTTNLHFDPGVNVIVGPSDSGKTAIIRALRWLVWNRPLGNAIRSTWGGKTHVEVHLDFHSGHSNKVLRIKDNEEIYFGNGIQHKAFGTSVPEEVKSILNITDINLQQQLDQPFLLTSTPGQVAQHFNHIAKFDKIDTGLKNITKWLREHTQKLQFTKTEQEKFSEELKGFDYLEKLESEVEVLEELEQKKTQQFSQITTLNNLISNIEQVDEQLEEHAKWIKVEPELEELLKLNEKAEVLNKEIEQLEQLIEDIEGVDWEQSIVTRELGEYEKEFHESFPDVCPLCDTPK